ncbi:hypothetical protein OWV82_006768 [Melia azedarach]|uniref:Uncharacterized protein n=1 Tax=Melia azedarach TaxID=155640 RepID=A0ACC1YK27_MELAZ|nr:hypothetical protein OWV82_006768 [Melia azedarach]
MASTSSISFIQTLFLACLLASPNTTMATRHLPQTASPRTRSPFSLGTLPPLSKIISAISPKADNCSSLSQGSFPPLSSITSAVSPQASKVPSFSGFQQGSFPPLSSIRSGFSPKASPLPPAFSWGSLPRFPGGIPAFRKAAPSPKAATSPPTRAWKIPKVPSGQFSWPVLFPPPARGRH